MFGKSEKESCSAGIKNRPMIYTRNKKYIKIKEQTENVISDLNFIFDLLIQPDSESMVCSV